MARLCSETWIQGGMAMLDHSPDAGLSIERLARRLGVTRGSFYHHFASRRAFVDALLGHWEHHYTTKVIAYASAVECGRLRLQRYVEIAAPLQPGREVALRRWADKDDSVRQALSRVDAKRLEFVRDLARRLLPEARSDDVERFARVGFLAFVGLQQTGPHSSERLRELVEDWLLLTTSAGRRTRSDWMVRSGTKSRSKAGK